VSFAVPPHISSPPPVAVLFSGGLDSSILLAHLLAKGRQVVPLYVDCELVWQPEELRWARRYLRAVDAPGLAELVILRMPLADLYDDHWSITGCGVPGAHEPDEHVYLPGRNPLLMIKAHVWCRLHGVSQLALGSLKSNPFADATDDFFAAFETAMDRAVSGNVKIVRPLADLDKRQVMELGRQMPLEWTFSCLAPVGGFHCGTCNKCAERQAAFQLGGLPDPTRYSSAPQGDGETIDRRLQVAPRARPET
jgi:7-cyano-7-deazaguanine synthase